jgi:hypothetical protein
MSQVALPLDGGIGMAALRSLPAGWPYSAEEISGQNLARLTGALYRVTKTAGLTAAKVDGILDELAGELGARRPLLLTVLFCPGALPALLPALAGRQSAAPADGWLGTCWMAEAAWRALSNPLTDPDFAAGDRELLVPLAARLRFLALTEPMRQRAETSVLSAAEPDGPPGGIATRLFGTGSWNLLVGRCNEARRIWLDCLDSYQSQPFLAQADPRDVDEEIRTVVFRRGRGAPLGLSGLPLRLTAEDKTVIDDVTERHLLPRFDLRSVIVLGQYDGDGRLGGWHMAITAGTVLCGLAAVVCAVMLRMQAAAGLALACYLLIGAGVLILGPAWAAAWLLRLPAAATVGVIALIALVSSNWGLSTPHAGLAAAIVLAVAACGYLAVEVRNHGVAGRELTRVLGVAGIGAAHALMVSLLGLVYVAPAFAANGARLARLWHAPGYGYAGMILLLATAWCLAVGVFSQVLWDDRPITAPLAHLQWRARGKADD